MNKLAILAFALLAFFSFMLWYLANGSLNEYLKSQVILQSNYYSKQQATVGNVNFSPETGIVQVNNFSLSDLDDLTQQYLLTIETIEAQLAKIPTSHLNGPSIQKKTTTIVNVASMQLSNVHIALATTSQGKATGEVVLDRIKTQLATDYPAQYPELSAQLYAEQYPERSEELALAAIEKTTTKPASVPETNVAIIASKEAKQRKRLLGKAITRVIVQEVTIDKLSISRAHQESNDNMATNKDGSLTFTNVSLGRFGQEEGLASNQLGGELLKQLLQKALELEKEQQHK